MKQFINIYIISFVLILSQLSLFSSCKDEDTVAELKLDRTAIQIKEGSEGILKIESGSGFLFLKKVMLPPSIVKI